MTLDPDHCYRALVARDRRFDGVFFVAVSTTGIYCRPICPARTPGRARCTFYAHAAEAERAGFRACFRCRPERAPGMASVDAAPRLVQRALRAIGAGALDDGSVAALAKQLGVTDRHLRRSIERAIGAGPIELAQTRRLGLAKQLLQDTQLPITDVAFAAGYRSLRRFHATFRAQIGRAPSEVRRSTRGDANATLYLEARGPFASEVLLRFFANRALPGLEEIDETKYRRLVMTDRGAGWLEARPAPNGMRLHLDAVLWPRLAELVDRVRVLFDLDARPALVDGHLGADPHLAAAVRTTPGMRVPGTFDRWELLVRTILAQQISTRAATTLCTRLVERFGAPIEVDGHRLHAFPDPARLARAAASLPKIGLVRTRATTLATLARRIDDGTIDLSPASDHERTLASLLAVPGIGPWTTQAFALRALRDPDVFLPGDLAIRRALGSISPADAERRSQAWRPWRAYALMHLWNGNPLMVPDKAKGSA